MFDTPEKIEVFRAITIKNALLFYIKHKMQVNTAYTPKNMLLAAKQITGKEFKPRQYKEAADALQEFINSKSPPKTDQWQAIHDSARKADEQDQANA